MSETENNIITFGCRLNACESEIIQEFSRSIGLDDYTLINTCAVTAEAERKLRQTIRKLYKKNPDIKIILTGCASELHPDKYFEMDGVVGIVSNKFKLSKAEYLNFSKTPNEKLEISGEKNKKVRGFLQIQNGCDQKCTYCIVRVTRGPNVSFDKDKIVAQAEKLLQKGYKEIFLTGVNISSYGRDLKTGENLATLIKYILDKVPNLKRLGLSSLDPADIDDELIDVIATEERLLPHIHESIQSGDDLILKRMLRRHSREQVVEINHKILERRPDVVFGADIIVGFPTETDEMFGNTKKLLKEAKISLLHSFPFSKRPGTPAARMPQVPRKIALARVQDLKIFSQKLLREKLSEFIGKECVILAEDGRSGKTNSFIPIISLKKLKTGNEYRFLCESISEKGLVGKPLEDLSKNLEG